MTEPIDHNQLFRELLSTFFSEFIELFLPQVTAYLEPNSMTFLQQEFFAELDRIGLTEQEQVMEIVTSWMKTGMQQEAQKLVLRQLSRRVGALEAPLEQQITELSLDKLEALSEVLLDFSEKSDLVNWLAQHR